MQQLTHIISKGNPWKSRAACLQRLYGVKISKEEVLLVDAVPYTALNAKNQGGYLGKRLSYSGCPSLTPSVLNQPPTTKASPHFAQKQVTELKQTQFITWTTLIFWRKETNPAHTARCLPAWRSCEAATLACVQMQWKHQRIERCWRHKSSLYVSCRDLQDQKGWGCSTAPYLELSAFAADKSFSEWFLTPFPTELCTEFMI